MPRGALAEIRADGEGARMLRRLPDQRRDEAVRAATRVRDRDELGRNAVDAERCGSTGLVARCRAPAHGSGRSRAPRASAHACAAPPPATPACGSASAPTASAHGSLGRCAATSSCRTPHASAKARSDTASSSALARRAATAHGWPSSSAPAFGSPRSSSSSRGSLSQPPSATRGRRSSGDASPRCLGRPRHSLSR